MDLIRISRASSRTAPFTVMGMSVWGVLAPAWEGRQGAGSALVSRWRLSLSPACVSLVFLFAPLPYCLAQQCRR